MKLFGYNNIDHRIKAGKHVRGLEVTQEPYYNPSEIGIVDLDEDISGGPSMIDQGRLTPPPPYEQTPGARSRLTIAQDQTPQIILTGRIDALEARVASEERILVQHNMDRMRDLARRVEELTESVAELQEIVQQFASLEAFSGWGVEPTLRARADHHR